MGAKQEHADKNLSAKNKKAAVSPEQSVLLESHGIEARDVIYTARLDRDSDGTYLDNYVFLTETEIIFAGCLRTVKNDRHGIVARGFDAAAGMLCRVRNKIFGAPKAPVRVLEEISFSRYKLELLDEITIESISSGCSIYARVTEEKGGARYLVLSYLSALYKEAAEKLVHTVESVRSTGLIPESIEDASEAEERICPVCGRKLVRRRGSDIYECPKCSRVSSILKRFASLLGKYRFKVGAIMLCMIVSAALGVITPYLSSGFYYEKVLDSAGEFYGNLGLVLILIVGTRFFSMIVSMLNGTVTSYVSADIIYDLKKTIFSAFERLSVSFFTGRQTGGLMQQVDGDARTLYWMFSDGFPNFCINIVQVGIIFVIMLCISVRLTVISVISVPIAVIAWWLFYVSFRSYNAKRFSTSRSLRAQISDVLAGMRIVKTFAKEEEEAERFDKKSKEQASADYKASAYSAAVFPLSRLILYFSTVAAWGFGGWAVMKGDLPYADFFTFITYMGIIHGPVFYFFNMIGSFSDAINSMRRMMEIVDAVPEIEEKPDPVRIKNMRGEVEFRGVDFSYVGNRKVIDDVSFRVAPGETLGIVGHTGAGKSTIANLIIRLYDPKSGQVLIDGIPTTDLSLEDLHREISIVSQETYLFVGSIYDNIAYARPEAGRDEIIAAAKIAGAHEFIMKLPDGYQTQVGIGYKSLSGGERQRVSIARAILRDPKILILDEATASMDTHTERLIQKALSRLTRGRTTIIIAHRLSTLRDADKIIVIDEGRIPEEGTHTELVQQGGIYAKLYKLQLDALKNIGVDQ